MRAAAAAAVTNDSVFRHSAGDIQEAMKKNSGITATRPGWPRNSRGSFLSRVVTT